MVGGGAMMALSGSLVPQAGAHDSDRTLPQTITEAAKLLRTGQVSVTELTTAYLECAKQFEPILNPFITLTEEHALTTAAALDRERRRGKRGPLHGIPVVYKDNFDTAGILTTRGSQFYSTRVATDDAEAVRKLHEAGVVMLGKANMNEFAAGVAGFNQFYGNAVNPWDTSHWPGGSSSGTGVAIASGLCLGGLGTDTGVSIRGPASWLGLVGVRPSYGRVSVRGTFPRAYTFDTVGPLAHTVADAAALLTAIAGYDPQDPFAIPSPSEDFTIHSRRGVRGLRLGIVEDFTFRKNVNPEVAQAVQAAIDTLANLGADIRTVPIPLLSGKIDFRYPLTILLYEFNQILGDTYRAEPNKNLFGPVVRANIAQGEKIPQATYQAAIDRRPGEIAEIRQVFRDVDAFITPTHPFVAPPLTVNAEADAGVRQFTVPISYTGFPAISIPCGFDSNGLPIGLQIVANDFQEGLLFRIAAAFEGATDFHQQHPQIYCDERFSRVADLH
jgi:aspartyl-tRNA(Asn)/glutamyl-tRNA(Gln) amidotransferase subunit A